MIERELGRFGPIVSALGLGCMPMSGVYGSASDAESIATIHRALDLGITLFDTADVYGRGHNERLVGRALRGRCDSVVVATKFGNVVDTAGSVVRIDGRPEYVRNACEASLTRLGLDHIDLYQLHRVDPDTPIEETVGALADLVIEGKIRYIGLSEALSADLRRAMAVHPIATLQSEYSILERGVENDVLQTCEELGVGFLAFAPLVRGLLAGSLTLSRRLDSSDTRRDIGRFPRLDPTNLSANSRLARAVEAIAQRHATSGAQVALAWLLGRKPWIVPIPGTKRAGYLADNVGAAQLVLTPEDEAELEPLASRVSGDRYGSYAQTPRWVSPPLHRG